MANISRNTFDKLKHYVNVRMQQGVPLVDADWNEKDDIRKHELQLFLKWFAGNGVPKNNDGFRILPRPGVENDFLIKGGENGQPGICLVDGREVRNETDIAYDNQVVIDKFWLPTEDLLPPSPTPPEEATSTPPYILNELKLVFLSPPDSGERTDLVYLDVWEREVDAWEDSTLLNPAINIETCVRMKLEWVARVAEGTTNLPAPVLEGHVFYPLATIKRTAGQAEILQEDITDLRTTGLAILSDAISIDNGNVGIGKTAASEKLEVNGRIKDQTGFVMPAGGVIMWSGASGNIPEGWVLCDGTNGAPDLRDRFIVGAGNTYSPDDTGGQETVVLTVDQMPAHDHTATQGEHNHGSEEYDKLLRVTGQDSADSINNIGETQPDLLTTGTLQPIAPTIIVENTGGGEAHENRPPYYALCFIMKL